MMNNKSPKEFIDIIEEHIEKIGTLEKREIGTMKNMFFLIN